MLVTEFLQFSSSAGPRSLTWPRPSRGSGFWTFVLHAEWLQSCPTPCNPVDCSPQAPQSTGFSRQESWSGSPFPSPGDPSDPGIQLACPVSPELAGGFFITNATWEARFVLDITSIDTLMAQTVKNLPAVQETWVQSLGREDPVEKGMATPSSILACRIPWTEEPSGLQSMVSQTVGHN